MRTLKTCIYDGELHKICIEAQLAAGLPGFSIVGLASTSIKESTERIKAAFSVLENFKMPTKKITINLSPSDLPKNGSLMDLGIALLVYFCTTNENAREDFFVFGELGLDCSIKPTAQLFSLLLFLSIAHPGANVIIPEAASQQAALIPNLNLYSASTLSQAIDILRANSAESERYAVDKNSELLRSAINIANETYLLNNSPSELDFADIRGQERAKRACLLAALGMHNILFEGSPGCGKSMCAKRLASIMPPITLREMLEQNAYRSLNGDELDFSGARSFRSPHRSSTISSILGGGTRSARVGELALAHSGVLFFDEFAHFPKMVIESLREPLEDNKINISRVNSKICYETKFLFVAAMNPCPCGARFRSDFSCTCSSTQIAKYKSHISQPIYDRIDIYVAMEESNAAAKPSFSTQQAREMVLDAFYFAKKVRGQDEFSGKLSEAQIARFCQLENAAQNTLQQASARFGLSARGANKVLKLARSIADFAKSEIISDKHLREALSYRFKPEN